MATPEAQAPRSALHRWAKVVTLLMDHRLTETPVPNILATIRDQVIAGRFAAFILQPYRLWLKGPEYHQRELVDGSDPTYKQQPPQLL